MKKISPVIKLDPQAAEAIKAFLADKEICRPIRIDLCFKGCCDPSLELRVDKAASQDVLYNLSGLQFVISPETYELTGDVTISHVNEADKKGFIVKSQKPLSEWDGFGVCEIKE
jgi:Fe-S cluster assembly iron-binding protein IscA